ncbi:MAG: hypothetical protein ACRDIY_18190 [Chloroflexota bacterium]
MEETVHGILIAPRLASTRPGLAPVDGCSMGEDLLRRDLNSGPTAPSPGVLTMLRLGDALRSRLRAPIPAGVGD